jgi:hypothetical protein
MSGWVNHHIEPVKGHPTNDTLNLCDYLVKPNREKSATAAD